MMSQPLSERLSAGYRRFRAGRYNDERVRYDELAREGQKPRTMIVACSDSRSAPETIFDAGPGELFVLRNVAALVPVYAPDAKSHGASAALEFAVHGLGVTSIVVMGHGRCCGVAAAIDSASPLTDAGSLTLHSAWFDISLGELHALAGSDWLPQPYDQAG